MKKALTISLLFLFFAGALWAQPRTTTGNKPAADTSAKLQDVLVATNEDCDLFIDNQPAGTASKTSFRYLKLAPGRYSLRAKSKTTGDEWSDSFTVAEGGNNEVFVDLLLTMDENRLQREKARAGVVPPGGVKASAPVTAANTVQTKEEAAMETLNFFLSNLTFMKGGSFVMGNNRAPARDETEHTVSLSPFYFSKYEVTQHQWEAIMGTNPSVNRGCVTCPVENVSWNDAMKFVEKLNAIGKHRFRLPTEAEWEYAMRFGGRAEIDSAGGQEAFIRKTAWFFSNAVGKPHPVGLKDPTAAGVYDLSGNVSEWCLDWYSPVYYGDGRSRTNPKGAPAGKEKVIRGGNFKDYVGDRFRPSFRNHRPPTTHSPEVGFRLVLEPDEQVDRK